MGHISWQQKQEIHPFLRNTAFLAGFVEEALSFSAILIT